MPHHVRPRPDTYLDPSPTDRPTNPPTTTRNYNSSIPVRKIVIKRTRRLRARRRPLPLCTSRHFYDLLFCLCESNSRPSWSARVSVLTPSISNPAGISLLSILIFSCPPPPTLPAPERSDWWATVGSKN